MQSGEEEEKKPLKELEKEREERLSQHVKKEDTNGVAIPMQYADRYVWGEEKDRYRFFSSELPAELQDRGVTRKEFEQIIRKVNRIWHPFPERVASKCRLETNPITLLFRFIVTHLKLLFVEPCFRCLLPPNREWLCILYTIFTCCFAAVIFCWVLTVVDPMGSRKPRKAEKVAKTQKYFDKINAEEWEERGMCWEFRYDVHQDENYPHEVGMEASWQNRRLFVAFI